jgi:hypothetical protein
MLPDVWRRRMPVDMQLLSRALVAAARVEIKLRGIA